MEACSFTKTKGAACGAVGVLTYEIRKHKDQDWAGDLLIMFSVPYDYNLYENWFALGVSREHVSCDEQLFHRMYYDSGPFTRATSTGSEIRFSEKHVYVKGTMSPAGRSIMKVELWGFSDGSGGGTPFWPNEL